MTPMYKSVNSLIRDYKRDNPIRLSKWLEEENYLPEL